MAEPFAEPTYTVSQLGREIRDLLAEALPAVWVSGEVQRLIVARSGHVYFELVEKGERDEVVGKLDGVIWKGDWTRISAGLARHGQRLADGLAIRCRAAVTFYPPNGRLQINVREVDPAFTLGQLELRRRETLAALERDGLLGKNRELPLSVLPLAVGLVTSVGSAAYHDFLATLRESGYGFRVLVCHAAVQGREAESEVVAALTALAGAGLDCLCLVRGGGARTDLAAFDSRAIAGAVATCPVPVLTGLGHEIDQTIADLVAHSAHKTPTKVAELLVERVRGAEMALLESRETLLELAATALERPRSRLERIERGLLAVTPWLAAAQARLEGTADGLARLARARLVAAGAVILGWRSRLGDAGRRRLERRGREREVLGVRLVAVARGRLATATARADGHARLIESLSPERTLRRGFSLTRTASGAIVRRPEEVRVGESIESVLALGRLWSRVEVVGERRDDGEEARGS